MADTVGGEIPVNSTTTGIQNEPAVAPLADGGFVVAWEDKSQTGGDTDGTAIRAQVFGPDGSPEGGEILVNTTTVTSQEKPSVVGLNGGGFVVAWADASAPFTGTTTSILDIRAQRFDSDGTKTGGEFLLNSTRTASQDSPDLAPLDDGGFVAAWTDGSPAGGGDFGRVTGQVFSPTGGKEGGEFVANTTTTGLQSQPKVTDLADGGFAMVWEDDSQTGGDTSNTAIRGQAFTPSGGKEGGEVLVNAGNTLDEQDNPAVAGLTDGRYAAAFDGGTFSPDNVATSGVRLFNGDGSPAGDAFRLSETTVSSLDPALTALPGGNFVGAFEGSRQNDAAAAEFDEILVQEFTADGSTAGDEFTANTTLQRDQRRPEIATLEDGGYVVVWEDQNVSADPNDVKEIRAQVFERPDGVPAPGDDDGSGGGGGGETPDNPSASVSPNIVVLNGEAQTLALPFAADARGTAAGETVQVPAGAAVTFGGNAGDRIELADPLSAVDVTASGNQLTLSAGDTQATIALNADVEIAFADGSTTASIGAGAGGGVAITLGGSTVGSGFDESAVPLDAADASALSGNTGVGNPPASTMQNLVALSGEPQTLRVPFAADVRGTGAAETLQVPAGANVAFGGNAGDEVEFTASFADHSFSQSGNILSVQGPNGAVADIALNAAVELDFADGSTSAELAGTPLTAQIGGQAVGQGFDPASVSLDSSDVSALAGGTTMDATTMA